MRPLSDSLSSIWILLCVALVWQITYASAYFIVSNPQANSQWVNNVTNVVTWIKGVEDGITGFDIEMASISQDGLILIAKNVPSVPSSINLFLADIPPSNDYFFIFINSTNGNMYATSSKFTVLAASSTPSATPPSPSRSVPTVTVVPTISPTAQFATTFPPLPGGAVALLTTIQVKSLLVTLFGCALGAFLTVGW